MKKDSRRVRVHALALDHFRTVVTLAIRSRGHGLEEAPPPSDSAECDLALGIAARTIAGEYERQVLAALDGDVTREVTLAISEILDRVGIGYEVRERPGGGPEFIVADGTEGIAVPAGAATDMLARKRAERSH